MKKNTKTSLGNNWTIEIPKFGIKPRELSSSGSCFWWTWL